MRALSQDELVLLAAAQLHVPSRRLRALARGEDQALKEWVASESARKLAHARHAAREAAQRLQKLGAAIVTIVDASYPSGLRELEDPPAFLCVRGMLPSGGLAIVGSRTPPPQAVEFARDLARRCGMPVVSGLALGIDAAAHHGALDAGSPTIAYVGTGLGTTYPPEHRALGDEIVAGPSRSLASCACARNGARSDGDRRRRDADDALCERAAAPALRAERARWRRVRGERASARGWRNCAAVRHRSRAEDHSHDARQRDHAACISTTTTFSLFALTRFWRAAAIHRSDRAGLSAAYRSCKAAATARMLLTKTAIGTSITSWRTDRCCSAITTLR